MAQRGRPGIPYEDFVKVWEQLVTDGRASTNIAHDILGGSKSTIAAFRERYERDKASKTLSIIKSVELTEAVHQAIAGIKVKEIDALQKEHTQLKSRLDELLAALKTSEERLAATQVEAADTRTTFEVERLSLERKLAAAQARVDDGAQREQQLQANYEQLAEQCNQAKQAAAVAEKEVELLRETQKR